jgi:hypothetical protein
VSAYIVIAAIFFALLFFILAVIYPKALVMLIWPVLFCYPHRLTYGLMPMNMGFDDFYIILVFTVIVFRFGIGRFDFPMKAVLGFYFVFLIADLTGLITNPYPSAAQIVLKSALKTIILVLFTWIMSTTLQTERDLRSYMLFFLLSITMASLLAIADYFAVPGAEWFYVASVEQVRYRATGPFISSGGIGNNLVMPIFATISLATLRGRPLLRTLSISSCVIYIGTIMLAISRSGWLGLIVGTLAMALAARRRHITLIAVGVIIVGVVVFFGAYWTAVIGTTTARYFAGGKFTGGVRFEIWRMILKNPYPAMLFFGRGWYASISAWDWPATPHNVYIDIVYLLGLGGTIFFIYLFTRFFRVSGWLRKNDPDPLLQMFSQGIWLGFIAVLGTGITSDPLFQIFTQYSLFFWLSWIWARQEMLAYEGYLVPYAPKGLIYSSDYAEYNQPYETYTDQAFE